LLLIEVLPHLAGGAGLEKSLEDELDTLLHLPRGMFLHAPPFIAHQAHGKLEGEIAPLGFIEQSRMQARPDRIELHLRAGAFETQQQAAIGSGRVIDTIAIGD
jgi:hypothetical protein